MTRIPLPDIRLDGRVVIMTGADRGLGRQMATSLALAGARVALASPSSDRLAAAAEEIAAEAGPGHTMVVPTDITDLEACRALVARTAEALGRVDALFNNARRLHRGPGIPSSGNALPLWETDPRIWSETITVNVIGTFFMTRAAVEHFRPAGHGKVVNLVTSIRNLTQARSSPYGVSKAALESATQIWAADLAETGVTVNALLPGGATDSDPDRPQRPGARPLLPIDVMDPLAVWLASERSDGVTGGRFVGSLWDPSLPPDEAAHRARQEPVFVTDPAGA